MLSDDFVAFLRDVLVVYIGLTRRRTAAYPQSRRLALARGRLFASIDADLNC
jgi:hypothetical protein